VVKALRKPEWKTVRGKRCLQGKIIGVAHRKCRLRKESFQKEGNKRERGGKSKAGGTGHEEAA